MTTRHALAILLCLAWIIPGLVGHDPWKPDEAYTFGVVYELLRNGDWLVPHLAGEPWLVEPPLVHWSGALTAMLLSPPLALHDAARVATGLYMAVTLLFCALTARELYGRGAGVLAAVLLLGAFGLVLRSHQLTSGSAALAGFAFLYYGCALGRRSAWGALWLGTGIGMVFMSQGVLEAVIALAIVAVLPLANGAWRTRAYAVSVTGGLLAAAPWLTAWPALLYARSPALFDIWLAQNSIWASFTERDELFYYLTALPWYAWPLWALGLWTLWLAREQGKLSPPVVLPLAGFAITLLIISLSAERSEIHALPLLLPLTLLATPAVTGLRRGAGNAWYWFSIMGFTFFIVVGWFYWSALELGVPARLHAHLHRLQPGYEPGFKWLPFLVGTLYTLAWFVVLARLKRTPERPALVWATGVTVVWALLAVLFIGWLDSGKSYRSMALDMRAALPKQHRCIASKGLGEAQRAMLHYFAGIVTQRVEMNSRASSCDLMLVQGRPASEERPLGSWRKIWEGTRPGDKGERYRLYQRTGKR